MNELTFEYAAERLIRSAVESCAKEVLLAHLPPIVKADFDTSALPPSLRQRLKLVDQRDDLWAAVCVYFQPIVRGAAAAPIFTSHRISFQMMTELTCLARDLHLLIIASRKSAQVEIDLTQRRDNLSALIAQHESSFEPEARARLSLMLGVFNALAPETPLDSLRIRPGVELWVKDRLDEILDDAYLAEASSIRRFIAYESNKAAMRRDLRRILKAIVRERRWAREVFLVSTQLVAFPSVAANVLRTLFEDLSLSARSGPVVASAKTIPLWLAIDLPESRSLRYWRVPTRTLAVDPRAELSSLSEPFEYEEV